MKIKVYNVLYVSYEDNYLYQESKTFTEEEKAMENFNAWANSAKEYAKGWGFSEIQYNCEETKKENYYGIKQGVGTEFEFQAIVELKEYEIEV